MKEILYTISMANLLFFGVVLGAVRQGNWKANRWLAAFFLIGALLLLQAILEYHGYYRTHPALIEVFMPLLFLWGTTYYFYIRSLTREDRPFRKADLLHGLPALFCLVQYLPLYTAADSEKLAYLHRLMNDQPTDYDHMMGLSLLHFVTYLLLGFRLVQRHQVRVRAYFSGSLEKRNLSWLRRLNYGLLLVWLLWANFHGNELFPDYIPVFPILQTLTPLLLIGILFSLGYYAVRQNTIFSGAEPPVPQQTADEPVPRVPRPSGLPDPQRQELKQRLIHRMEEGKAYRNGDLTLPELAEQLGTSTNILSDLINNDLGQNFYDFVNRYRVEACKVLLTDPKYDRFTILAVAYEAGFNSKSTFHKAFREATGLSPGQFRKENRKVCLSV
ncbi:helix-turn-helix domain-containing protein [Larkinella soli]|uniref:helix-turn-helix domain-containing protein n=1 Tax=Larkinella soli TaxID=1770527 RepID=UPI000FFB068D|nr:helix-turn-helix transcriptional regulator [Larkinella soli]